MKRADLIAAIGDGSVDHRCGACGALLMPRADECPGNFLRRKYCGIWCQQRGKARRMSRDGGIALALLLVSATAVFAEPPSGADQSSSMGQWYRSLKTPAGTSCCSIADCRPVEAQQTDEGWAIKVGDAWESVPADIVLKRENPDGRPIACRYLGNIRYFVPPAGA